MPARRQLDAWGPGARPGRRVPVMFGFGKTTRDPLVDAARRRTHDDRSTTRGQQPSRGHPDAGGRPGAGDHGRAAVEAKFVAHCSRCSRYRITSIGKVLPYPSPGQLNQPELALKALNAAQKLNPHRPNLNDAVKRLERSAGAAEL